MIIAQISDTHLDPDDPDATNRIRDLERCVNDINGLNSPPDAIIHTGDLTHNGTPEKYKVAASILGALHSPLFIAAGNRDDRDALRSAFPNSCLSLPDTPFIQYSVEKFPVRLIALDTLSKSSNMGDFCQVRADTLHRLLAQDRTKPSVIFMHHPPFEVLESKYRWQFDSQEAISMLERSLDGHSQVLRAFCGHSHRDAQGTIAGIPVSCAPSVAVGLRLGEYPEADETAPVYQIHRFDGRQSFSTETRVAR